MLSNGARELTFPVVRSFFFSNIQHRIYDLCMEVKGEIIISVL